MKWALSTTDGRDWHALEFSERDASWRKSSQRGLVCLGCGSTAFFRAPSRRKTPAFGARHRDNCALLKETWGVFRYLQ